MNAQRNTQLSRKETYDQAPLALYNQSALRRLAVNDSGFVFDPVSGESFTVNATGRAVLQLLQEQYTLDQVVAATADQYQVDNRQAERDILDFVVHLRKHYK
jgi:PqqD family protein of HPr-rel-A system